MDKIKKILIANRGEIALRVMRTCKEMGLKTVAVYSEADMDAPHVRFADESALLGAPPSSESYLNVEKIIRVCKELNVDAIHPGYGFLSENADFAKKVAENEIIFIGPSPEAIQTMGSKLDAKAAVAEYNIPMIPGTEEAVTDVQEAKEIANGIGYPVLIKASAGGGGKGMRVVDHPDNFEEEMERAISEATSAFGDGSVFLEKYIVSNKHIEFQVLGDQHGNVIHLFDRECSIQRRHQKVIEEAPSPTLSEEKRQLMGETAVKVAKACGYYSAGTVEFIYDDQDNFFFLEMNTRLQVEHPVTEEITGVDLVKEQIEIAQGRKLTLQQEDITITGHALEVRVYAEDPSTNFLPDIGKLSKYSIPKGPGIRLDDGFEEGMQIPIYYDPMIAKLVVHAKTREDAIRKMTWAIDEYTIVGVETTLAFCSFVINHEAFANASFTTKFVETYFDPEKLYAPDETDTDLFEVAAMIAGQQLIDNKIKNTPVSSTEMSRWRLRKLHS